MAMKFMYITNDPQVARIAQNRGVDRIWIDLETRGKDQRQKGHKMILSNHTIEDIKRIRPILSKAELMVRINSWNPHSKEEIDNVINAGADIVMLPYWKTVKEVKEFLDALNGRAKNILLLETKEAVEVLDDILELEGINEIFIGLNDLHLSYGMKFLFEPLAEGIVDKIAHKIMAKNFPFGFGGVARLGYGWIPAENILMEQYRLGASLAILSRSFCNVDLLVDYDEIDRLFDVELKRIREFEKSIYNMTEEEVRKNHEHVKGLVADIVQQAGE